MMRRILSAAAAATAALALVAGLAACSADPLAEQYRAGDNKGYIAANGFQTQEIAPDQRGEPVQFSGTLDNGSTATSADYAGKVLVVNFWYATCGPCIVEAPRLEQAYQSFQGQDVAFLGVNTYDQPATALSFARDNDVSYSSLMAVSDAELKLAFADKTPINATPTTLVLDRQGRVAARVIGELPEASILEAMVQTVVAESA
ncbi:alkyl hydroperoxide reductase [Microbacterium sp. T32]|nr:alkyl hydroperoxide reductase [Microbacterium sp. T32]